MGWILYDSIRSPSLQMTAFALSHTAARCQDLEMTVRAILEEPHGRTGEYLRESLKRI
jgi:hypothetical protein